MLRRTAAKMAKIELTQEQKELRQVFLNLYEPFEQLQTAECNSAARAFNATLEGEQKKLCVVVTEDKPEAVESVIATDHIEMDSKTKKMYMHAISGDVATLEDWKNDFDNMDSESWFGLPADECEGLDWIEGGKLSEVVMVDGEWVEV